MKRGWTTKRIGDVCEVVNGGTPRTSVATYWGGEHLWITPAEMGKRESPYVDNTERKLTDDGLRESSARMLPPYSVILSSRAPIGHLVINTRPMSTNQGCKSLIPDSTIEHKFLYYYLSSIVELLDALGTGATFRELSGGKLREVSVPIAPLSEQRRIVGVLDEAFAGLATAQANTEKNVQNARALFESHLHSVFTQRGEGWVTRPLADCRGGLACAAAAVPGLALSRQQLFLHQKLRRRVGARRRIPEIAARSCFVRPAFPVYVGGQGRGGAEGREAEQRLAAAETFGDQVADGGQAMVGHGGVMHRQGYVFVTRRSTRPVAKP